MNGNVEAFSGHSIDSIVVLKKAYFRPSTASDVVRVGHIVCLNSDLAADYKERTTQPATGGTTYAEGAQTYNARIFVCEKPAEANMHTPHVVIELGNLAGADGDLLTIAPLVEGAVVPVWTNANCTLDATLLGVAADSYIAQNVTNDGSPLLIGVAAETVNRSSDNGLVWMRMCGQVGLGVFGGFMAPKRSLTTGDAAGLRLDISNLLTGAGATGPRTYGLYITGSKASGALITAGCDDAALRISISNYVENEEIYNFRGINVLAKNRSGGTVGECDNIISVATTSGSTTSALIGLKIDNEHMSADTPDVIGGLDIALCREGGAGTEEYGINIRTRGTINSEIDAAIRVSKDATDHAFTNLFNIETDGVNVEAATGDTAHDSGDIVIPIVFNGATYYLVAQDSKG